MSLTPLKYLKFLIFVKLLILRYQLIEITLSKPHLECTSYKKQINVKKYEWKLESIQILLVGDCIHQFATGDSGCNSVKKFTICNLRIFVCQLFRAILICVNPNLVMNTNEF